MLSRLALWRGANQIGKSWALAWDILHTARGTHPLRPVAKGPVRILVIGESWVQMEPLCQKIWDMLPKDEIDPRVRFERGGGFRGFKDPRIPFVSGPGVGSVIIFATYSQGAARLAGGSFHAAYLDEPPPEHILGEVLPRLSRYHGTLRISMTPTPESPPLLYLRDMVEDGTLAELQTSLTLDAVIPRGGLFEKAWKTQRQLDELIATYLEVERDMRVHGAWTGTIKGAWLTGFSDALVTDTFPTANLTLAVGIDHGTGAGRQRAVLVGVEDGPEPTLWILDEAVSDGRTTPEDDAKAIWEMVVKRNGLKLTDVNLWVGDRAHGGDRYSSGKENRLLVEALAHITNTPLYKLPPQLRRIPTPRKRRGSMTMGVRQLNAFMLAGRCRVSARCKTFIEGAKAWKGNLADPHKDVLDAARYAMERLLMAKAIQPVDNIPLPR
ncbi:MAG: terminase family protein [Pseudomonadota bacterium]|nr:terminase family protein [Pseudomonadota bacterium]